MPIVMDMSVMLNPGRFLVFDVGFVPRMNQTYRTEVFVQSLMRRLRETGSIKKEESSMHITS